MEHLSATVSTRITRRKSDPYVELPTPKLTRLDELSEQLPSMKLNLILSKLYL